MSTLQLLDIGLTDNTPAGWFAVLVVVVLLIVVSRIVWRAVHGQGNADCRRNVYSSRLRIGQGSPSVN